MENLTTLALTKAKQLLPNLLTPIGALILPFIPNGVLANYREGKMTIASLKNNEAMFDKLLVELDKRMEEESKKIIKQEDPFNSIQIQEQINLVKKYTRYINCTSSDMI